MAAFIKQFTLGASLALITSFVLSDHIQSTSSGLKNELLMIQEELERIRLGGDFFETRFDPREDMRRRDLVTDIKSNWNDKVSYGILEVQKVDWVVVAHKGFASLQDGVEYLKVKLGA